jgi:hypothetical protein
MARVTAAEVLGIMDSDCDVSTTIIDTFIIAAEEVVTNLYTNVTISVTLLKEIERYLVAHMLTSTLYRMAKEEKVSDAQIRYTGEWKEGLNSTPYGQLLQILDTTGTIGKAGKKGATINAVKSFDD